MADAWTTQDEADYQQLKAAVQSLPDEPAASPLPAPAPPPAAGPTSDVTMTAPLSFKPEAQPPPPPVQPPAMDPMTQTPPAPLSPQEVGVEAKAQAYLQTQAVEQANRQMMGQSDAARHGDPRYAPQRPRTERSWASSGGEKVIESVGGMVGSGVDSLVDMPKSNAALIAGGAMLGGPAGALGAVMAGGMARGAGQGAAQAGAGGAANSVIGSMVPAATAYAEKLKHNPSALGAFKDFLNDGGLGDVAMSIPALIGGYKGGRRLFSAGADGVARLNAQGVPGPEHFSSPELGGSGGRTMVPAAGSRPAVTLEPSGPPPFWMGDYVDPNDVRARENVPQTGQFYDDPGVSSEPYRPPPGRYAADTQPTSDLAHPQLPAYAAPDQAPSYDPLRGRPATAHHPRPPPGPAPSPERYVNRGVAQEPLQVPEPVEGRRPLFRPDHERAPAPTPGPQMSHAELTSARRLLDGPEPPPAPPAPDPLEPSPGSPVRRPHLQKPGPGDASRWQPSVEDHTDSNPATRAAASEPHPGMDKFFRQPEPTDDPVTPSMMKRVNRVSDLTQSVVHTGIRTMREAYDFMARAKEKIISQTGGKDLTPPADDPIRPPSVPDKPIGAYSMIVDPQKEGSGVRKFFQRMMDVTKAEDHYAKGIAKEIAKGFEKISRADHEAAFHVANGDAIPADTALVQEHGLGELVDRWKNLATQIAADPRVQMNGMVQGDYVAHAGLLKNSMEHVLQDFAQGESQRKFNPSLDLRRTQHVLPRELVKGVNMFQLAEFYARQAYRDAIVNPWIKEAQGKLFGDARMEGRPMEQTLPDGTKAQSFGQIDPTGADYLDTGMKRVFRMKSDWWDVQGHKAISKLFNSGLAEKFGLTPDNALNGTGAFEMIGKAPWVGSFMKAAGLNTYTRLLSNRAPVGSFIAPLRQIAAIKLTGLSGSAIVTHVVSDTAALHAADRGTPISKLFSEYNPVELATNFYDKVISKDPALVERMKRMGVYDEATSDAAYASLTDTHGHPLSPLTWLSKTAEVTHAPIGFVDKQFKAICYANAEAKAIKLGFTPDQAMLLARDAVVSAQNYYGPENTPNWMANHLVSAESMFMRSALRTAMTIPDAVMRGKLNDLAKYSAVLTGGYGIGKMFGYNLLPKLAHWPAKRSLGAPLATVPIDAAHALYDKFSGTDTTAGQDRQDYGALKPKAISQFTRPMAGDQTPSEALGLMDEDRPGFSWDGTKADLKAIFVHPPPRRFGSGRR